MLALFFVFRGSNQVAWYAKIGAFGKDAGVAFVGVEGVGDVEVMHISGHQAGGVDLDAPVAASHFEHSFAFYTGGKRVIFDDREGVGGDGFGFQSSG